MNWFGKRKSTKCARYFPDYWATIKAGLKGLSWNLSYKVLLLKTRSPTDDAINPTNYVVV
jgi:hypothetical protein